MKILIIGGGVIGMACAFFLQKEGCEVTIVDKGDLETGCSYENAGMVVPSHFIPLAAPGVISQGMRWLLDAESPFYIKPRLDRELLRWGWHFYRATHPKRVEKAIPILRDLSLLSKSLYQDWAKELDFSFAFTQKGLLMLCRDPHCLEEEAHTAQMANQLGIEAQVLDQAGLKKMESHLSEEVIGGVYFPGDAHLDPQLLLAGLKKHLRVKGVRFLSQWEVKDFEKSGNRLQAVVGEKGRIEADEILVASGSWSPQVVKALRLHLPLQAGKGYSITLPHPPHPINHATILTEAKVAVTPFEKNIRFGGTMEIAGLKQNINTRRVQGILNAIPRYYRDYEVELPPLEKIWTGLRPCSPDGLPYIGRVEHFDNLSIASGHAMMGLSLAPITGKLIAETITHKNLSLDSPLLRPQRYL